MQNSENLDNQINALNDAKLSKLTRENELKSIELQIKDTNNKLHDSEYLSNKEILEKELELKQRILNKNKIVEDIEKESINTYISRLETSDNIADKLKGYNARFSQKIKEINGRDRKSVV